MRTKQNNKVSTRLDPQTMAEVVRLSVKYRLSTSAIVRLCVLQGIDKVKEGMP